MRHGMMFLLLLFLTAGLPQVFQPSHTFSHSGNGASTAERKGRLGVLEPTGRTNPDGTETWAPRGDSVLAGSIEVDVRADGLIVRQKVLRPVRVSGNAFSSLWQESGSATPRSDVALPQGTQPQGPLSVTWFQGLLKRLLELSDF